MSENLVRNPAMLGHWTINSGLAPPQPLHLPSIGQRDSRFTIDARGALSGRGGAFRHVHEAGEIDFYDSADAYLRAARDLYGSSSWDTLAYQMAQQQALMSLYIKDRP